MKIADPLPPLFACDVCGLEVAEGEGASFHKEAVQLAWHNCRQVLDMRAEADPTARNPTIDDLIGAVIISIQGHAKGGSLRPETGAQVLRAVAEVLGARSDGQATFNISEELKAFLARRPGEGGDGAEAPSGDDGAVRPDPTHG